ncbi:MAG: hypothetical protein N2578_03225 [Bdellovibrionaceae bacterium]|nr:hypothetical protein [Pseudobdellovibrionaceae bacterium]
MKNYFLFLVVVYVYGCASGNCRQIAEHKKSQTGETKMVEIKKENDPASKVAAADRVRVYKPDGSLQCGMGKSVPLTEMQKDLGSIEVFASFNKNDGLMRIQQCGTPTGNCNVYEIHRRDLPVALKAGFKEWLFD